MTKGLLYGVRVLELGEGVAAPYCGKILANFGADVIKVESLQGDIARRMGPFPGDNAHPEKSGIFLALNANKYGISLDINSDEGVNAMRGLAASADIIIESMPSGWLDDNRLNYGSLTSQNPSLIMTSLSSFGAWGPYAGYKLTDLTLFQMSGQAHSLPGSSPRS